MGIGSSAWISMSSSCMAVLGFSDKKQLPISTCSYFMEVVKSKSLCFKKTHVLRAEIPRAWKVLHKVFHNRKIHSTVALFRLEKHL